ncbi:MAG: hypothetical protein K2X32_08145 [Phycisphaerales bacterium]|nr:hypothetical protein [Phycisphaerales bacterium]
MVFEVHRDLLKQRVDALKPRENGIIKPDAAANLAEENELDNADLAKMLKDELNSSPEKRRFLREMLGCLDRVGILVAVQPGFSNLVAMTEGRFVARAWDRWHSYIFERRTMGSRRHRVYSGVEHLARTVALQLMDAADYKKIPSDSRSRENRIRDNKLWDKILGETRPITERYPSLIVPRRRKGK